MDDNPVCMYCGETVERTNEALLAHIIQCEKRPEKKILTAAIETSDKLNDIIDHARDLLSGEIMPYLNRQGMLADDGDALDLREKVLAWLKEAEKTE